MAKKNSRAKANRLVSKYLTDMAKLEDACIDSGGEARLCARAEKLAEIIWKHALGFEEFDIKTEKEVVHPPSISYMRMLLERMEGKVQDVSATESKKSIADRISETTKKGLNKMAEEA